MITVVVASGLFGCSSMPELSHAFGTQSAPQAKRFAVLLTNSLVPVPPELSGAPDRILGRITRYLAAQGRERRVIEAPEIERLWLASIVEASESDTVSHDFHGAMKIFARELGGPAAFDALVVSSLVYREGWLHNGLVKWDGAVRRPPAVEDESEKIPDWFEAKVPVVSLHVMVFDADGELIFENYGGVDLAHSLALEPGDEGQLRVGLLDPVLTERRFLREGVELAFDPYLPRDLDGDW
jgi:hypothetical protein